MSGVNGQPTLPKAQVIASCSTRDYHAHLDIFAMLELFEDRTLVVAVPDSKFDATFSSSDGGIGFDEASRFFKLIYVCLSLELTPAPNFFMYLTLLQQQHRAIIRTSTTPMEEYDMILEWY